MICLTRWTCVSHVCREKFIVYTPFATTGGKRAEAPLELIHTDVCGKINAKSLSEAEYFLTFVDDKTRYVSVIILFQHFQEWKAMVERSTGHRVKSLCTDNGGEYTSLEFQSYLKKEGITHELTVQRSPEQNGVAD